MRVTGRPLKRRKPAPIQQPGRSALNLGWPFQLAVWLLLILPAAGISQLPVLDGGLEREWLDMQRDEDQRTKREWWQDLKPDQLTAYIRGNADVNISDGRGWTPLHSAARYNADPDVLRALLKAGAVIDAKDRSGDTPLHWAAAENANVEIAISLIQAGADVNARDKFGWLPIHSAADRNSNPEVIGALLTAGAHRNARAYFFLFHPAFLLKHNSNMTETDKKVALALLKGAD